VRFRIDGGFDDPAARFSIDDVNISFTGAQTAGYPEFIGANQAVTLAAGAFVELTFEVTVDDPLPTGLTAITNTATTTSAELPIPVSASATNVLTIPSLRAATVAGRVWLDADGDQGEEAGEPGIANVEVTLRDLWGTPVATLRTDVGGRYLFSGVAPGDDYYVEVTGDLPSGLTQSHPDPAEYGDDRSEPFDLASGGGWTEAMLGYRPAAGTVLFGDQAWVDANANGLRDAGELALAGVTVDLFLDADHDALLDPEEATPVATASSDAGGHYLLSAAGVSAGDDFFVAVRTMTDLTTPGTYHFPDVAATGAYLTADFGYLGAGTFRISDRVWLDGDGDGTFEPADARAASRGDGRPPRCEPQRDRHRGHGGGRIFAFTGATGGGADYTVRSATRRQC